MISTLTHSRKINRKSFLILNEIHVNEKKKFYDDNCRDLIYLCTYIFFMKTSN